MSALLMNRRLVLEAPERVADGAGGYHEAWAAVGELWADVRSRSGREAALGEVAISRARYVITVRGAPAGSKARPHALQRFREGTRIFHIQSVSERDAQGRYLTCLAQEENAV